MPRGVLIDFVHLNSLVPGASQETTSGRPPRNARLVSASAMLSKSGGRGGVITEDFT
jgi:hypothetical protein